MKASIRIEGLDEVIKGLVNLSEAAKTRITRNIARAGARTVKTELRAAAPRGEHQSQASAKYGTLTKNIAIEQLKASGRFLPYYLVTTGDAFWGSFLDIGTGKYNTAPGSRAKGAAARTHIKPNFWFRRTVGRIRPQVTDEMISSLERSLIREISKIK